MVFIVILRAQYSKHFKISGGESACSFLISFCGTKVPTNQGRLTSLSGLVAKQRGGDLAKLGCPHSRIFWCWVWTLLPLKVGGDQVETMPVKHAAKRHGAFSGKTFYSAAFRELDFPLFVKLKSADDPDAAVDWFEGNERKT